MPKASPKKILPRIPQLLGTAALILVALVLGNVVGNFVLSGQREKPEEVEEAQAPQEQTPEATGSAMIINIGGKELKVPREDASDAEKGEFSRTIISMAVEADSIEIGKDCSFSPEVVRVVEGTNVTLSNADESDHTISIVDSVVNISSGGKESLEAKFSNGIGLYGVACDGTAMKGFIEVVVGE